MIDEGMREFGNNCKAAQKMRPSIEIKSGGEITLQSDVSEADIFDFEYKRYSKDWISRQMRCQYGS